MTEESRWPLGEDGFLTETQEGEGGEVPRTLTVLPRVTGGHLLFLPPGLRDWESQTCPQTRLGSQVLPTGYLLSSVEGERVQILPISQRNGTRPVWVTVTS